MLDAVRQTGVALKTKLLQSARPGRTPNFNVQLRRELGLFASVRPLQEPARPARPLPAASTCSLVREITEDLYTAIEHEIVPGVVQSIKVVTEAACRRFFRFAFELARTHGRKSDPLHPQGEHPQAGRRPVPRLLPPDGRGLPGDSAQGDDRR